MIEKGGIIGASVVENVVLDTLVPADEPTSILAIFVGVVVLVASITTRWLLFLSAGSWMPCMLGLTSFSPITSRFDLEFHAKGNSGKGGAAEPYNI